jgi:hypothetical protein
MKKSGRMFLIFGLLCFLLSACGGIPKICGPRDSNMDNFEVMGFKSGSTVTVTDGYLSQEEEDILEKEFAKKNLKYLKGYRKQSRYCFDIYKEYIEENQYDLTLAQQFEIRKKHNAVRMRPDYAIDITQMSGFGTNSGSRTFTIHVAKDGETAITLSDFDYYTNRCWRVQNVYNFRGPIACPIGTRKNSYLCHPYLMTELIKFIRRTPTY